MYDRFINQYQKIINKPNITTEKAYRIYLQMCCMYLNRTHSGSDTYCLACDLFAIFATECLYPDYLAEETLTFIDAINILGKCDQKSILELCMPTFKIVRLF